jgi:hypothetical protein
LEDDLIFRPADYEDARKLAKVVRQADADEVYASSGQHPYQVLVHAIDQSFAPVAAYYQGEPAGMFGVASHTILGEVGIPWLLTGRVINRCPKTFYKFSRAFMDDIKADYSVLIQMVDARHTQALAWLERLGFHKQEAQNYGYLQLPFHPMVWRRHV